MLLAPRAEVRSKTRAAGKTNTGFHRACKTGEETTSELKELTVRADSRRCIAMQIANLLAESELGDARLSVAAITTLRPLCPVPVREVNAETSSKQYQSSGLTHNFRDEKRECRGDVLASYVACKAWHSNTPTKTVIPEDGDRCRQTLLTFTLDKPDFLAVTLMT